MFNKRPLRLAKAKILADEGYGMAMNSGEVALQHQKYIVEVHPDDEPAFHTEVTAWISWLEKPEVGDILQVQYRPGTTNVELVIKGDPRYDWELRRAAEADKARSTREELLNAPVPQGPLTDDPTTPASDPSVVDQHEADLIARIDELTKAHRPPPSND